MRLGYQSSSGKMNTPLGRHIHSYLIIRQYKTTMCEIRPKQDYKSADNAKKTINRKAYNIHKAFIRVGSIAGWNSTETDRKEKDND